MSKNEDNGTGQEIPQSLEQVQDLALDTQTEMPEWSPEISPELAAMAGHAANDDDGGAPAKLPESEVEVAERMATEVAGFAALTLQGVTGRDYGLDESKIKEFGKGVAPCLVKYGYSDAGQLMEKWGVEIQAAISTGALLFGVYRAHQQYRQEDSAANDDSSKPSNEKGEAA